MKNQKRAGLTNLAIGNAEVRTREGTLRGVTYNGLYIFRGIEYGKAERFELPVRTDAWKGIKEAICYGNSCPELTTPLPSYTSKEHPYFTVQSEDCLYLNIWTDSLDNFARKHVRVFFMDKDFSKAYSVEGLLHKVEEAALATGAVIVTVNTRLNILGYLDLSEYGDSYAHSGNAGLADRKLALEWIKENISSFGGDGEKITIFQSEQADPETCIERTKEEALRMTRYLLEELNLSASDDIPAKLKKLRYDELTNAALNVEGRMTEEERRPVCFSPVKDECYCPGHPVADTPDGLLRGCRQDGAYIFRGIKYADAKRFHMPVPVKAWKGIKNALVYGPVCPEIETVQPDDNYTVPHVFYPQHEDCQYLNIWTPSLDKKAKLPILVWLHGGGFATGSGIEHFAYNGKALCEFGNIVVVTLNHRLNVLGYLDLSAYGKEYRYSGNAGTADIVEALRWIRSNIQAFGGDPDNVTIFGQSGGGGKVAALLQTPSADGLFHRAVIQSGLAHFPSDRNDKYDMASKIFDKLGIAPSDVKKLEELPFYQLQEAILSIDPMSPFLFGPHKDKDFYLGDAFDVGICAHAKAIPVMVGNVLGEFSQNFIWSAEETPAPLENKNSWSPEKTARMLEKYFGKDADKAKALQLAAYPDKPLANLLFTDSMFRPSSFDYLRLRAKECSYNTFGYMFTKEMPPYGGILPWHNAEIPYVFHNADCIEPSYIPGATERLQDIMARAWCSFAACGNPGWAPYTAENHYVMYFDETCVVRDSTSEEELVRFLEKHPVKLKRVLRQKSPKAFGGGPRINY